MTTIDPMQFAAQCAATPDWALEQLDRVDAQKSLRAFTRMMWPTLEPTRPLVEGWSLHAILDHLQAVTDRQITDLVLSVPPGTSKALDSDTPVLTTWGWKRHGDLQPGDFVFGPDGQPKRVLACTEERVEESYSVEFDDGSEIVASGGHLWSVGRDMGKSKSNGPGKRGSKRWRKTGIFKTTELQPSSGRADGWKIRPDSIDISAPVQFPPKRLLIDPYVLGAWLGDGTSLSGDISSGHEDIEHFRKLGRISTTYPPDGTRKQFFYRIAIEGLRTRLRMLGLISNKHIPDDYMEASVEQRLALLQGLMDTDGCCSINGACSFVNLNAKLAASVRELACSLGIKAHMRSRYTKLNGKRYGPHYKVEFTPPVGVTVFRLARKQARVIGNQNEKSRRRYVESVTPVGARVVKCITVEGALYLAGRSLVTTHNSLSTCVLWPAHEWGPLHMPHRRHMDASYSTDLTYRDNRKFRRVIESPLYQRCWGSRFAIAGDANKVELMENDKTGFKLASSVGGRGTGERVDVIVIDDPLRAKDADSDAMLERATRWFDETLSTRATDPGRMARIIIMQRLSDRDIVGHVIAKEFGFELLVLPMRYEHDHPHARVTSIGFKDPRKVDGELLCPERFSEAYVAKLERELGEHGTAAQLQQRPVQRGGGMFKKEWWQFVDQAPVGGVTVRGWDLAATASATAAYTVGCKGKMMPDGRVYVLDVHRGRWESAAVRDEILWCAERDGNSCVQDIPQDPGQAGKAQVNDFGRHLMGHHLSFSLESGDKETRANPFASHARSGNVFLVRAPWNDGFIAEAAVFNKNARYKDQVDAASRMYAKLLTMRTRPQTFVASTLFTGE